jgi:hypothetical protein
VQGSQPVFAPSGEIFFRVLEGNSGFAYRVRRDGTGLRKAIATPIAEMYRISPDGRWLAAWAYSAAEGSMNMAFPLEGGAPVRTSKDIGRLEWSPDGKLLYISVRRMGRGFLAVGNTYVIPLPPGQMLPDIPPGGFATEAEIGKFPGATVIEAADVAPGPAAGVYAFSREATQRNLFRIPIP